MQQTSWDDGTTIAVIEPLQKSGDHKKVKRVTPKPAKIESIPCTATGCDKLFISDAERDNHVDFHHSSEQQADHQDFNYLPSDNVEMSASDEGDETILARTYEQQEETIKPQLLTAESLQALADSTKLDSVASITHSLHHASIRDGSERNESIRSISERDPRKSSDSIMSLDETTFSVVDDEQQGEPAEQEAPELRLAVKILLYLWAKFVNDKSRQLQKGIRQHATRAGQQGRRSSHSISKESMPSTTTSSEISGTPSLRRKRSEGGDNDGDGNVNRKNLKRTAPNDSQERPFACPFNKFDSYRFGSDPDNTQYKVCSTWCDVKTAYLKQHLLRNHCVAEFCCDRCGLDLVNLASLRAHRRLDPPCALGVADENKIMPEHQLELGLRSRNAVGIDRTIYWNRVYDTIFGPEARRQRPVDPHYTGPYRDIVRQFVTFSETRIPDIIQLARQRLNLNPVGLADHEVEMTRTVLQEAMQLFMYELTQNRPPSIQEIRTRNTPVSSADDAEQQVTVPRDYNRPLPQLLPANWQGALPMHGPHPVMQSLHMSSQQSGRPTISAPATPAAAPDTMFPGQMNYHQQSNYVEGMWSDPELSQFDEILNFDQFLLGANNYTAQHIGQTEVDDYVIDDFLDNPGPSNSSRRERKAP